MITTIEKIVSAFHSVPIGIIVIVIVIAIVAAISAFFVVCSFLAFACYTIALTVHNGFGKSRVLKAEEDEMIRMQALSGSFLLLSTSITFLAVCAVLFLDSKGLLPF